MEPTSIKPRILWDIIPVYGAMDYLERTTFKPEEKRPITDYVKRGTIFTVEAIYGIVFGIGILDMVEGKPSLILKVLEKIF